MNKMRLSVVAGLGSVLMAVAGVASAHCDWRDGAVDLDLCPAVRASIDAQEVDELAHALAALEAAQNVPN
ncbi:MAG: hypothetical protein ABIU95_13500 [Burkholderiales bacterium]